MKKIREKSRQIKFRYWAILFAIVVSVMCGYLGDRSEAAQGLTLSCDGYELNSATAYQMKNKEITLILGSEEDPIYADKDKYEVRWSIETGQDIASIRQGSEQIYGIVSAQAPGEVTVLVTVYNKIGDEIGTTIGSITCKIQVVFGIDTSRNDNVFKYPFEDSTDKAIFLHTDSQPEHLILNYGESENAQWTTANDEVVAVSESGTVTPKGAGNTKITATYTPPDSPDTTYTTTIDVYVYPSINDVDSNYQKKTEFGLDTGGLIYTDTNFVNGYEAMQRKMAWVIKKDDGNGGEYIVADSLGTTSDLISINPVSSRSNQLQVNAKAGKYYVYFYPKNAYEGESHFISDEVFAPTVLTLSVYANFNDYKETIPIGSTYDIAEAFNLTTEEFMEYFDVTMSCNVGSASNYASLSNGVVTALNKNEGSTTIVNARVVVKSAYKHIISQLLNPNRSDAAEIQQRTEFDVELTIADVFKLDQSYMTMYAGAEVTLNAYFNSENIAGTNIVWSSSNEEYATVDATGKVTAKKITSEDVVITAVYETDTGAKFYAECQIRIVATADNLAISDTELSLNVGDSAVLNVTCSPDVTYPGYDWYVSDPECLTFSLTGDTKTATVTAKAVPKDGKTVAVIVTNPANKKSQVCNITINAPYESIQLTEDNVTMKTGTTHQLRYTFKPNFVTQKDLDWQSLDTSIVTVDEFGTLTGKAPGTTYVMVSPKYNPNGVYAQCAVTVVAGCEKMELSEKKVTLNVKDEKVIKVTLTPKGCTTVLDWNVSDDAIAGVTFDPETNQATIVGKKVGKTIVFVKSDDGPSAQIDVTVLQPCLDLAFSPNSHEMLVGETYTPNLVKTPADTTDAITWTTYNSNVAKVDENGVITGVKAGTTFIQATSASGRVAVIQIIVKAGLTSVTLKQEEATIQVAETITLAPEFTPEEAYDKSMTWRVTDPSIATIEADGVSNIKVTGVKAGVTLVTGVSNDGGFEVHCLVTVEGLNGVTLEPENATIVVNESITLAPKFEPENAYDKSMTWAVADSSIAKIEAEGVSNVKVTGVKGGVTLVQGVATDGGYVVNCLVTVKEKSTSVTVSPTSKLLQKGRSFYIKATVHSETATNKKVRWTSSKKSVATVSSSGKVKGKKIGTAYITATARDRSGASARCKVRVIRRITSIRLNKYTARMLVGSTMKLRATILPRNATIKSLSWSSSDNSIATVDATGRIHGLAPGLVKIRAKAQDGSGKSAVCLLTVTDPIPATGVDVANNDIIVVKGRQIQSGIQVAPANSTDKLKFYSDDPRVARINQRGKIYANKVGQATVYGETADGKRGAADVLVVRMNRRRLKFRVYDTETLRVDEIKQGVTWHSKNPLIASVDQSGKVTGRRKGVTTIYAKVRGLRLSCKVTVTGL